jgi:hypothetical protein
VLRYWCAGKTSPNKCFSLSKTHETCTMFRKPIEARGQSVMKLDGIANIKVCCLRVLGCILYLESPSVFSSESGHFRTYPLRRKILLNSTTAKQIVEMMIHIDWSRPPLREIYPTLIWMWHKIAFNYSKILRNRNSSIGENLMRYFSLFLGRRK